MNQLLINKFYPNYLDKNDTKTLYKQDAREAYAYFFPEQECDLKIGFNMDN